MRRNSETKKWMDEKYTDEKINYEKMRHEKTRDEKMSDENTSDETQSNRSWPLNPKYFLLNIFYRPEKANKRYGVYLTRLSN